MIIAQLLQLVQHGNRVNGLGEVEHGIDGLVDLPVLLQIEILRLDDTYHIGDAAAVNEDGAQNRLLCLQRLRLLLMKQFFIHNSVLPFQ